jgi:hypothetical protein
MHLHYDTVILNEMEHFYTYRSIINLLEMNGMFSEQKILLYWYLFYWYFTAMDFRDMDLNNVKWIKLACTKIQLTRFCVKIGELSYI